MKSAINQLKKGLTLEQRVDNLEETLKITQNLITGEPTMNVYQATTTLSTNGAGVVVLTPGFQAKAIFVRSGPVVGGSNAATTMSGYTDLTRKSCDWSFDDGTLIKSDKHTDRLVSIRDNIGGVLTEVTSATNPVATATQVKLDVTTTANSANYKTSFLVLG